MRFAVNTALGMPEAGLVRVRQKNPRQGRGMMEVVVPGRCAAGSEVAQDDGVCRPAPAADPNQAEVCGMPEGPACRASSASSWRISSGLS